MSLRIDELVEMVLSPHKADVMAIVDIDENVTKRITVEALLNYALKPGTTDGQLIYWNDTLKKWTYTDASTTISNFTLQSDYDGTIRQTFQNTNTGTGNLTSLTLRNDANHRVSFNMAGENNSFLPPHSSILYNEGYGPSGFVSDGAQDFVFYTDPTDSHNMLGAIANEVMRLSYDGRLTIGTGETTDYPLQVFSNFAYGISAQGGFNLDLVDRPAAVMNASLTTGGSIDAGLHYYKVTYVTIIGETDVSQPVGITTDATNNAVQLTNIPTSTDARVLYRKIYRSKAGATNDTGYFLTEIYDNTTTEYLDTVADSTLTGKLFDGGYRPNTTSKYITANGTKILGADKNSTFLGLEAARNISGSSAFTTAIGRQALYNTDAFANTALGHSAGYANTSGQDNVYVGYLCGRYNTNGNYNVIIGDYAGLYITSASLNVVVGANALRGNYGTYTSAYNVALGYSAGRSAEDATGNVFIGYAAGFNASQKTDVSNCMCLGRNTYADADGMFVYGDNTVVKHIFQSGNVGYGTDSPQRKLDIRGDGNPLFRLTYTPSSIYVDFNCTSAGYYKIEPTGSRVGINCTPTEALDIDGNVNLNNQFTQVAGETNPGYYMFKSGNLAYGMKLHYLNDSSQFGTMLFTGSSSNTFLSFGRSPNSGIADNDFVEFARFERNTGYFGINETSPNSHLHVNGSISKPVTTKTANYAAAATDYTIIVDASSNTVTITLPAVSGIEGRLYNIKCIDSTYTVTVDANGSETIDGELTQLLEQWDNMKIQAYSGGWIIL